MMKRHAIRFVGSITIVAEMMSVSIPLRFLTNTSRLVLHTCLSTSTQPQLVQGRHTP